MQRVQNLSAATPETIRQELSQTVAGVLKMIERGKTALEKLQEVRELLESIPLSSGEYCVAQNRLQNAHRYLVSDERGAARFELRMLAGSLRDGHARPCH